ncbi:MAG TPA: CPBP family intramembrane glutamic endopeptidase [Thermoanaerobaculia bacterium]
MALTAPPLAPLALLLRLLGPAVVALLATWAFDWLCRRRGLMPPGFRQPWRRVAASALVFFILWFGIFAPLGEIGLAEQKLDLSSISTPRLFLLHGMLAAVVLGWMVLGFAAVPRHGPAPAPAPAPAIAPAIAPATAPAPEMPDLSAMPPAPEMPDLSAIPPPAPPPARASEMPELSPRFPFWRQMAVQLGLVAPDVSREVLIGLLLGICAWGAVLLALLAAALAIYAIGGEKALPKPSAIVPWIASLPVLVRLMVSLSAGFVEETFFRGFLQPRIGIVLSSGFFVLAHLSYGQPFMLLGITLLSLIYAFLVRWRQTIWPAIAAHALFDGVQLLVIIPMAMRLMGTSPGARPALAPVAALASLISGWL